MCVYIYKKKMNALFSSGVTRLNSPELLKMKSHVSPSIRLFEETKATSYLFFFSHPICHNQHLLTLSQVNLSPASKALGAQR